MQIALIAKQQCILCGLSSDNPTSLCLDCKNTLPAIEHACYQCGNILLTSAPRCGTCQHTPPPFHRTIALFHYEHPIDKLITALKFHQRLIHAKILGEMMTKKIEAQYKNMPMPEIIIPIPLHKKRLQERGYNQALELARPIAKYFNIKIDTTSCYRTHATKPQAYIPANERSQNVQNAFALTFPIVYQHIAIIDDVITTGSTMTALAKLYAKIGIEKIDIWCCARTSLF